MALGRGLVPLSLRKIWRLIQNSKNIDDLPPNYQVPFVDDRIFIWLGWRSGRFSDLDSSRNQTITRWMFLNGFIIGIGWMMMLAWIILTGMAHSDADRY